MSNTDNKIERPAPLSVLDAVPEPAPIKGHGSGIAESGENYLETILLIRERTQSGLVRAVDIANELGYSKPSVSRALNQLKEKMLIKIEPSGAIVFTADGLNYAKSVFHRHRVITYFLRYVLNVPATNAEHDACRMEHIISENTFSCMKAYLKEHNLMPDLGNDL